MGHAIKKRAEPRLDVEIWGKFRHHGRAYEVILRDLSQSGCRFFDRHGNLPVGEKVSLRIAGMGPFEAEVKWQIKGYVGVAFDNPLYQPVMDHIVANSQAN